MSPSEAYQVLGIDPATSTPSRIRRAYRAAILKSHPDTVYGSSSENIAHERTVQLNKAFDALEASGFPRFAATSRDDRPTTGATEQSGSPWIRQPDVADAEFEAWRKASMRGFGSVFKHDVEHMGTASATAAWGYHIVQALVAAGFGVLGIVLASTGQPTVGLILALIGFGGAAGIILKLDGSGR